MEGEFAGKRVRTYGFHYTMSCVASTQCLDRRQDGTLRHSEEATKEVGTIMAIEEARNMKAIRTTEGLTEDIIKATGKIRTTGRLTKNKQLIRERDGRRITKNEIEFF